MMRRPPKVKLIDTLFPYTPRFLSLCTLFFEPSTRTRSSFQLAAMRLGMDVLNFDPKTSSAGKGESDRDTLATLQAMGINAFAVRHSRDGAGADLAEAASTDPVLINAGDCSEERRVGEEWVSTGKS